MILQLPTLLALLGTALMAVVIFAPRRTAIPAGISFAPPMPPPLQEWSPYIEPVHTLPEPEPMTPSDRVQIAPPTWPALIDERARDCDAAARLALVDALAAVRAPWSEMILLRALDDEHETPVRNAIVEALARGTPLTERPSR